MYIYICICIYIYVVNLLRFSMIQCNLIFFFWDLVEIKCDLMQFKIKLIYFSEHICHGLEPISVIVVGSHQKIRVSKG